MSNTEPLTGRIRMRRIVCALVIGGGLIVAGCRSDMQDQPKYKPLRESDFFDDRLSARQPPEGTVARGLLRDDSLLYTGRLTGSAPPANQTGSATGQGFADAFPFPITTEILDRGEERFNIYCSVCHDRTGGGEGMVVRRGYRRPPRLSDPRLVAAPAGYFFDVITNGFGLMPDYATQISVRDRWAVVAYVRALQLSQNASLSDVPEGERSRLENGRQQ